jgi:hypothetical protein
VGAGQGPSALTSIVSPVQMSQPSSLDPLGNAIIAKTRPSSSGHSYRGHEDAPATIPAGHHTTTGSLFSLEPIKSLIGKYPNDFFYQIEAPRSFKPQSSSNEDWRLVIDAIRLNQDVTNALISNFFSHVHHQFPILEESSFRTFFQKNAYEPCSNMPGIALCLVVLALGKLVPSSLESDDQVMLGMEYFAPAHRILVEYWVTDFEPGLSLPTGLVLAAIYLCYITKPLSAWKFIYMASTKLQLSVTG